MSDTTDRPEGEGTPRELLNSSPGELLAGDGIPVPAAADGIPVITSVDGMKLTVIDGERPTKLPEPSALLSPEERKRRALEQRKRDNESVARSYRLHRKGKK